MAVRTVAILLSAICLTGCSVLPLLWKIEWPSAEATPEPAPLSTPTFAASPEETQAPAPESLEDALAGTYWTAVQFEAYDPVFGRTEVSQMPTDKWWADLFLNEDGTAQFREVLGDAFNGYLTGVIWQLGPDQSLLLTGAEAPYEMSGRIEEGRILLETPYGERFWLEEVQRPAPGGELCSANLNGAWQMTKVEENGRWYDAREGGFASTLLFETSWSELEGESYQLTADCYFAQGLDTEMPEYLRATNLQIELLQEPLFEGAANELWSVRIADPDMGGEFFLTLTDLNTLYLQQRSGAQTIRTAVYERAQSFLPEALQTVLYEEPADSLIFCWRNPPQEVCMPLEAMPVTALEPNGQDSLLLVGRWYETQVQFCTGEGVWDDSGMLVEWIVEQTLFDETIENSQPHWFSFTVPAGEPRLCMRIKRPWDDGWYLWPLTDEGGYLLDGWTFLTS